MSCQGHQGKLGSSTEATLKASSLPACSSHAQQPAARRMTPWLYEAVKLGKLAIPLLLQYLIANFSYLVNTAFAGHLPDSVALSSMVLATSLSMATGYTVLSGMASALDTLCSQAYGARNWAAMQHTLQRAVLIIILACIPVTLIWSHAEHGLLMFGLPADIAEGAARYLRLTLPALYMYSIHECVDKYLLSQCVVMPSLIITAVATALTPVVAWWFVIQHQLGLDGAAYAYVTVQTCTTAMGLAYLAYRELVLLPRQQPKGWTPFMLSSKALTKWGPYMALAVPAAMSYCFEGWATEAVVFLSGLLSNANVAVGVTGLAFELSRVSWCAAAAVGSAAGTRIAIKLGKGDPAGAQYTVKLATVAVLTSQVLLAYLALMYRQPLLKLLTDNSDVVRLGLQVMPMLACYLVTTGLSALFSAVLCAAGRQWWTAALNIVSWWCAGVPLAYYLGIMKGGGIMGLWGAFVIASSVQSTLQLGITFACIDWNLEVQRAYEAVAESPTDLIDTTWDDESVSGTDEGASDEECCSKSMGLTSPVCDCRVELVVRVP